MHIYFKILLAMRMQKLINDRRKRRAFLLNKRAQKLLRDKTNLFNLPRAKFMGKFRLPQDMVKYLIDEIRPMAKGRTLERAISLENTILCSLSFFAHGSNQKSVFVGISQPSISRCITETLGYLNHYTILKKWIRFPITAIERKQIIKRNHKELLMPRVIGIIDGTAIPIRAPAERKLSYFCRKGYYALNVMIICDVDRKIINVNARYPGANSDSCIWESSRAREVMEEIYMEYKCWIIGDNGYPLQPFLLTPIKHPQPHSLDMAYNSVFTASRNIVKRCIGGFKNRFRCLKKEKGMEYDPITAGRIVNAVSVLHNMCREQDIPTPENSDTESDSETDETDSEEETGENLISGSKTYKKWITDEGKRNVEFVKKSIARSLNS